MNSHNRSEKCTTWKNRPFRNPHHTASGVALVGGGSHPRPGEISLAHNGVLFLDELPEFDRRVLEVLREPLESGRIIISRAAHQAEFPAQFQLVAAMNPCPCGNYGDPKLACICAPFSVLRYKKKISGPLLDRIDIQINVSRETPHLDSASSLSQSDTGTVQVRGETPPQNEIKQIKADTGEYWRETKENITRAKQIQAERFKSLPIFTNAEMDYKNVDKFSNLDKNAEELLKRAISAKGLSLRAYHKIKKISRTVADLEQSEHVSESHVAEALALRINDKIV